jgi:hypothetical protein
VVIAGCQSPTVVNTGEPYTPPPTTDNALPPPPPGDATVVDAADYAADVDGKANYFFTTPSGRWACAIVPRDRAGCQATGQGALGVTGAPETVPDAAGADVAPNAIVVDRTGDAQFVSVPAPGFAPPAGAATALQFNQTLIVAGFRCNVQEQTGVSCFSELSGKGFTFSADGLIPQYSAVPLGAPPPTTSASEGTTGS